SFAFFFQAEDGIRDFHVTGVQTCALPIYMFSAILYGMRISLGVGVISVLIASIVGATIGVAAAFAGRRADTIVMRIVDLQLSFRSEERRVGKERSRRWWSSAQNTCRASIS